MTIGVSIFEGHVVTPEAAKKLQEAGFPKEVCLFVWTRRRTKELRLRAGSYVVSIDGSPPGTPRIVKFHPRWHTPAPSELAVVLRLPTRIRHPAEIGSKDDFLHIMPTVERCWRVFYKNRSRVQEYSFEAPTLGEAATDMYCFLRSKNLL